MVDVINCSADGHVIVVSRKEEWIWPLDNSLKKSNWFKCGNTHTKHTFIHKNSSMHYSPLKVWLHCHTWGLLWHLISVVCKVFKQTKKKKTALTFITESSIFTLLYINQILFDSIHRLNNLRDLSQWLCFTCTSVF